MLIENIAAGINLLAENKGHFLRVIAGNLVHTDCTRFVTDREKQWQGTNGSV